MTDPAPSATADSRAKSRVTWAGMAVNLPLALGKIVVGLAAHSPALVADGVHSLSDLASDVTVLWALRHSARGPDREHPWGHGRFETLATLAVAAALALAGLGIAWDAGARLLGGGLAAPGALALWVALASVAAKEALYHLTLRVGVRTGSALIKANAWHHRSDALSSVVAAAGIAGGLAGMAWLDPLAAVVIAGMLLRVAWRHGRPAIEELVDAQAPEGERAALARTLSAQPGVAGLRDLRLRRHGADRQADVSILVDPAITVTEAHRISEAARDRALDTHAALGQIVIHVEPAGHADGYGATAAPLRDEIADEIATYLNRHADGASVSILRLGYYDDGVTVEVTANLPGDDHSTTEAALAEALRARWPRLLALRLRVGNSGPMDNPIPDR